ncbi:MAG: aminotransferase class I/II-fold pyridoxal phosphate-dependent enzyme [Myxococcales bacterium]|nr:aminotransferase class I/II-fold pyridoxal phosphate-dependent enzyme [Myxococcales bacterium]
MTQQHGLDDESRPVVPPIVLSSTFAFPTADAVARAAEKKQPALYSRWDNPTVEALERRLALLEGAERAIACASGMAAISLVFWGAVRSGRPLVVQRELYGGTHEWVQTLLPSFGTPVTRVGIDEIIPVVADFKEPVVIYLETPANPLCRLVDIESVKRAAPPDSVVIVDSTFASPINLKPMRWGADLVVHSATKYLAGHHDVVAGVVCGNGTWMNELWYLRKLTGPVLDAEAAYRVYRGLETLELRVLRQNETALFIANRLVQHPRVRAVYYPLVFGNTDKSLCERTMTGGGGVLSFEINGSSSDALTTANRLRLFEHAPSLGGCRSLVTWPAGVSHVGLTESDRAECNVPDTLLRLSVGIEPKEVLWADLEAALQ